MKHILFSLRLTLAAGACVAIGACRSSAVNEAAADVPLETTAAKLKPKSKAASKPATTVIDGEPEEIADDPLSKAAAGLQKVLGKEAPKPTKPDVRAKKSEPVRVPKVYDAPPEPMAELNDASNAAPPRRATRPLTLEPVPTATLNPIPEPSAETPTADASDPSTSAVFAPVPAVAPKKAVTPAPLPPRGPVASTVPTGGTLRIANAALCTRVESFGRFVHMDRVPAGRETAVLIYSEYDGFRHRTAAGLPAPDLVEADGRESDTDWVVEIGQALSIYDASGVLKQHIPEQTARDTARRRRRDHFLVQRVALPALAAGTYTIKIESRDLANPGYVVEQNVPLIVGGSVARR